MYAWADPQNTLRALARDTDRHLQSNKWAAQRRALTRMKTRRRDT